MSINELNRLNDEVNKEKQELKEKLNDKDISLNEHKRKLDN